MSSRGIRSVLDELRTPLRRAATGHGGRSSFGIVSEALLLALVLVTASATTVRTTGSVRGSGATWSADEAITPAAFAAEIRSGGPAPAIVYVGFKALFRTGHIPGATFHGPASKPEGMSDLQQWAASQSKDRPVVVYCGCCPLDHCPNLVPAYSALQQLGFTRLRVLVLPTSFAADWVEKGYPVER
jgi:hypothetical protein